MVNLIGYEMELNKWPPLSYVSQKVLSTVRLAYVFGHSGSAALFITEDDEVLACGINCSSCLGVERMGFVHTPAHVIELQKKGVKGFSSGGNTKDSIFVVAFTNAGSVYVWGKQIGHNNPTTVKVPTLMSVTKKISEVTCGVDHCVALSTDGEVYCWGENDRGQLGTGNIIKSAIPVKVEAMLKDLRIIKISCGQSLSVVLADNGQVYAWGANNFSQLCLDASSVEYSSHPVKIRGLSDVVIKEVVCGMSHVLALTNVGDLYVWGKNSRYELGLRNTSAYSTPQKNEKLGKIIDIAASAACSMSGAMNENFKIWLWGDLTDWCYYPHETSFKSLHEVFFYYANPRIMYKPMIYQWPLESDYVTLERAFQDKDTCDLTLRAEGKEIFVHRAILRLKSNYFRTFLQNHWVETNTKVVDIDRKYNLIYPYVQYLYTGELEVDVELVPELLRLADEYQDTAFKQLCEKRCLHNINVDNVGYLFSLALTSNATNLMENCMLFAGNHISEVVETSAVSEWDADTFKEFAIQCKRRKLFRS